MQNAVILMQVSQRMKIARESVSAVVGRTRVAQPWILVRSKQPMAWMAAVARNQVLNGVQEGWHNAGRGA